jgi:hypothetical protein
MESRGTAPPFLTLTLDGSVSPASHPRHFTSREREPLVHTRENAGRANSREKSLASTKKQNLISSILLPQHFYFYCSLQIIPHEQSSVFHECVFVVNSCTLIFVPWNYWVFGLCPLASILKTEKMFRKLDLFLSLGEWDTPTLVRFKTPPILGVIHHHKNPL